MDGLSLFIYNVGIDNIPDIITKTTQYNDKLFNQITKAPNIKTNKQMVAMECNNNLDFIRGYNNRIGFEVKNYLDNNKTNIAVLQEVCTTSIDAYNFKSFVAGNYTYNTKNIPGKILVIGTNKENIIFDLPDFVYGEKINFTNFGNGFITTYPNDNIQVVRAIINSTDILYIINVHNRAIFSSFENHVKYIIHILGIILNIYKHDYINANIILCGDNNSASLFRFDTIIPDNFYAPINILLNNLINFTNNYNSIIKLPQYLNNYNYTKQIAHIEVLAIVFTLLGFKSCYDRDYCSIVDLFDHLNKTCNKKPFNKNDIIYYAFDEQYMLMLDIIDTCNFQLTTSAHTPYHVKIINRGYNNNKIPLPYNISTIDDLKAMSNYIYDINIATHIKDDFYPDTELLFFRNLANYSNLFIKISKNNNIPLQSSENSGSQISLPTKENNTYNKKNKPMAVRNYNKNLYKYKYMKYRLKYLYAKADSIM